ncbi:MAG TPA: hypothetical protein VGM10_10095 [Actinocrinis sp.]
MSQDDERPADREAAELRTRLGQLGSRIEGLAKEQRLRSEDSRQAVQRARAHAAARAVGVILISALFACTMGPWLNVPESGAPAAAVDAWGLTALRVGVGGQAVLVLFLLLLTMALATWAALSFTFPSGVTAAAGGVLLFVAEVFLQVSLDHQISQGTLSAQGSEAHIGPGYILLFVVTVLLVIWAIATAANARQLAE